MIAADRKSILSKAFIIILLFAACTAGKQFRLTPNENHLFTPDSVFSGYEDVTTQRFTALKNKYELDTIFHGETDEFKRILLIRNWINRMIKVDNVGPYEGDESVESVLANAMQGHGYHCGHFTAVQNAILNGYGHVARCILSDVGFVVDYIEGGGHHAINEVWVNAFRKWVLTDAKYDNHFEKNGIPLSALEVRDEYMKNKAADIQMVRGVNRMPVDVYSDLNRSRAQFASMYTWLSWGKYGNRFSDTSVITDSMNVYADEYFRTHTWLWDGKPHWAYAAKLFNYVNERKAIEWTPNTIHSTVRIVKDKAFFKLHSITPNFKTYEVKVNTGQWTQVSNHPVVHLKNDKNVISFRTLNLAGVAGPVHIVVIER